MVWRMQTRPADDGPNKTEAPFRPTLSYLLYLTSSTINRVPRITPQSIHSSPSTYLHPTRPTLSVHISSELHSCDTPRSASTLNPTCSVKAAKATRPLHTRPPGHRPKNPNRHIIRTGQRLTSRTVTTTEGRRLVATTVNHSTGHTTPPARAHIRRRLRTANMAQARILNPATPFRESGSEQDLSEEYWPPWPAAAASISFSKQSGSVDETA
jgi:hypothetical protein